jgi:hypothetical protein
VDGQSTITARARGLAGGSGIDKVYNLDTSNITANADGTRANVSVTGTFALQGVAAGASFADATNTVTADAVGIDGGSGDDTLINNASLATNATSTATTVSVAVDVNISATVVSAGASIASAATTATASATGMEGGDGVDQIENQAAGSITGKSDATAKTKAVSVDVSLAGFTETDTSTNASASYVAMNGGSGADTLKNLGNINMSAVSLGDGTSGKGSLFGYGTANVAVTSTADAVALAGGGDDDTLTNEGSIISSSSATAKGLSVAGDLAAAGTVDGSATATATTTGLDGGEGGNGITNSAKGVMTLSATASGTVNSYDIKLGGGAALLLPVVTPLLPCMACVPGAELIH